MMIVAVSLLLLHRVPIVTKDREGLARGLSLSSTKQKFAPLESWVWNDSDGFLVQNLFMDVIFWATHQNCVG
jgi:hypothetical protein